jgi:hypothetical protein
MKDSIKSGRSKINDLTSLLSPGQAPKMMNDIQNATIFGQSKKHRETWIDKVKQAKSIKPSHNSSHRHSILNQTFDDKTFLVNGKLNNNSGITLLNQ